MSDRRDHIFPMRKLGPRYLRRLFGERVRFGYTDFDQTVTVLLLGQGTAIYLTRAYRPERDGYSGGIQIARERLREIARRWAANPAVMSAAETVLMFDRMNADRHQASLKRFP